MNESVLNMLSDRLAAGGQALCAWVTMNEPAVAEALAREAFDAVVLDMQHGAVDFDGAAYRLAENQAGRTALIVRLVQPHDQAIAILGHLDRLDDNVIGGRGQERIRIRRACSGASGVWNDQAERRVQLLQREKCPRPNCLQRPSRGWSCLLCSWREPLPPAGP